MSDSDPESSWAKASCNPVSIHQTEYCLTKHRLTHRLGHYRNSLGAREHLYRQPSHGPSAFSPAIFTILATLYAKESSQEASERLIWRGHRSRSFDQVMVHGTVYVRKIRRTFGFSWWLHFTRTEDCLFDVNLEARFPVLNFIACGH